MSFKDLLDQSLADVDMRPGSILKAEVLEIGHDYVTVDAGLKSEAYIPITEFKDAAGEVKVIPGEVVDVSLEVIEDGLGETCLSRKKAEQAAAWTDLEGAFKRAETVLGVITDRVKGGFTVDVRALRAFLPGSLVDVRPVRDISFLEGKEIEFKLVKMDKKRNNVVVSRRAVIEEETSEEREELLASLQEGQEIQGVVKNLTDYGAFIDLGGIDGLLHITDISWKRVRHPGDLLKVGEDILVKVLSFDRERNRVSLGLKQLVGDPWSDSSRRHPVGARIFGKVTNITDYGCFVEIEEGIEGLVHMSEMDWTNRNIHPGKIVSVGDEVEVMVLEIDENRRRISLGIKQCRQNPWGEFAETHALEDKVKGVVKSITDFGMFIGLDGGIDGLVHLTDLSWTEDGETAIRSYAKGQEVEAMILSIDSERERISLGIKQLEGDPYGTYMETNPRGASVEGEVVSVDDKRIEVTLAEGIVGSLRPHEFDTQPKVGEKVTSFVVGLDRRGQGLLLSMNMPSEERSSAPSKPLPQEEAPMVTIGDIMKRQKRDESED